MTRRKFWSWLFFRSSPKIAQRSHSPAWSLETRMLLYFVTHCKTVTEIFQVLRRKLPFLQETDGILQGSVFLLQPLVASVKYLKPLSISVANRCRRKECIPFLNLKLKQTVISNIIITTVFKKVGTKHTHKQRSFFNLLTFASNSKYSNKWML